MKIKHTQALVRKDKILLIQKIKINQFKELVLG